MKRIVFGFFALMLLTACTSTRYTPIDRGGATDVTSETASSGSQTQDVFSAEGWRNTLHSLSPLNQGREAEAIFSNTNAPEQIRERALYVVATRPGTLTLFAQQNLANDYANADNAKKAEMEAILHSELRSLPTNLLRELGQITPRVQETTFPWILFVYEAARNNLLADNQGALERLGNPQYFANPGIFGLATSEDGTSTTNYAELLEGDLTGLVINPNPRFSNVCLSMVLPLSGNFKSIGEKVKDGAVIAKEVLSQQGVNVTLNIFDSESPSWVNSVASLPDNCVLVGGPLRPSVLEKARSTGVDTKKAFFAFSSQLPAGMFEGTNAWRFFTSTEDQLNTLFSFVNGELMISDYGVIYPNDAYGMKMNDLFTEFAMQKNTRTSSYAYALEDQSTWTKGIGEFLGSVERETASGKKKLPLVTSPVDAIFLPDSWSNMEMISSILLYQGAVDMPLMGTNLWEESLNRVENMQTEYYKLSIFPGAWDKSSRTYGALQLQRALLTEGSQADAWSALGYDFVQMASALNYNQSGLNVSALNQQLSTLQELAWAAAPFRWDYTGKATRKLFLFQPDVNGIKPLDKTLYKQEIENQRSNIR